MELSPLLNKYMYNLSKKTKVVCTIGPATNTYEKVKELVKAGMNVIRINFSHGNYEAHKKVIDLARRLEVEERIYIPIMLDTKGPEIRCHFFLNGSAEIVKDSIVRIGMKEILGTAERFSVTYQGLFEDINIGDAIKIDDGKLRLDVIAKDFEQQEIVTKAFNTHTIKDRKGVNIPSAILRLPALSEIDKRDLDFGCNNGIDLIAASFVRNKKGVEEIKDYLKQIGYPDIPVIAKIENEEGVENIKDILTVADGVMVARGDLGVEIPPEMVPIIQRKIIYEARKAGKPVITATQMLDSMQSNPLPTRAEVSDVATAIRESSDAVMLSGETATGQYPIEAAGMQASIARTIEDYLSYEKFSSFAFENSDKTRSDAIANSVANTANLVDAKMIFCFSETGNSAKRIAKSRPKCPIIMVTFKRESALRVGPIFSIYPIVVNTLPQLMEEMEAYSLIKAREFGLKPNDMIIITGGIPTGSGGTNFLRIVSVNKAKEF